MFRGMDYSAVVFNYVREYATWGNKRIPKFHGVSIHHRYTWVGKRMGGDSLKRVCVLYENRIGRLWVSSLVRVQGGVFVVLRVDRWRGKSAMLGGNGVTSPEYSHLPPHAPAAYGVFVPIERETHEPRREGG